MFDADAAIAALTPPQFKLNGTVYTGRMLSFPETLPFLKKFEGLRDGDPALLVDLARELCTAIDIPPDAVLSLPASLMMQALTDFFSVMTGGKSSPTPTPAAGTSSPPSGS